MVFILYMKSGNSNVGVNIGPARQNIRLLPITGPAIPPSKYEPLFDKVFNMRTDNGTRWGYLFFPLSSGCSNGQLVNAVDPNRLASVTVEMARAHVEYSIMSPGPSWTFNLVPVDLGLEEALQIPERQHLSPEQKLTLNDWSSIATIAGTALEVLRFIIRRRL